MKRWQKIGQGPTRPPSFGQNPKEQHLFFVKPSLRGYDCKMSFILFEGCMWYILIYTSAHHFIIWNHIPGRRASKLLEASIFMLWSQVRLYAGMPFEGFSDSAWKGLQNIRYQAWKNFHYLRHIQLERIFNIWDVLLENVFNM